jgi:hypothetical protein
LQKQTDSQFEHKRRDVEYVSFYSLTFLLENFAKKQPVPERAGEKLDWYAASKTVSP